MRWPFWPRLRYASLDSPSDAPFSCHEQITEQRTCTITGAIKLGYGIFQPSERLKGWQNPLPCAIKPKTPCFQPGAALMPSVTSREWRLKSRPQGEPKPHDFELSTVEVREPAAGEVQVRNAWM